MSINRTSQLIGKLIVFFRTRIALLMLICIIIIGCTGILKLHSNAHYSVYFEPQNTTLKQFNSLQKHYNQNDQLIIILKRKNGLVTAPDVISSVENATKKLQKLKAVTRLESYANYMNRGLLSFQSPSQNATSNLSSEEALKNIQKHPLGKTLIGNKGQSGMIAMNVKLANPSDAQSILQFDQKVQSIMHHSFSAFPNIDIQYSGILALNKSYIESIRTVLTSILPIMLGLLLMILVASFRSLKLATGVLLIGIISALFGLGIAGWMGRDMAAITVFAPLIIITLSIALFMHFIINALQWVKEGYLPHKALSVSMHYNFTSILLSALTTAIGFALLLLSNSPPIGTMGLIIASGIFVATLCCFIILPKYLALIHYEKISFTNMKFFKTEKFYFYLIRHRRTIITLMAAVTIACLFAITHLSFNDQPEHYFPKESNFSQANQTLNQDFNGNNLIQFSFDSDKKTAF